jgi:hypothetical protein
MIGAGLAWMMGRRSDTSGIRREEKSLIVMKRTSRDDRGFGIRCW